MGSEMCIRDSFTLLHCRSVPLYFIPLQSNPYHPTPLQSGAVSSVQLNATDHCMRADMHAGSGRQTARQADKGRQAERQPSIRTDMQAGRRASRQASKQANMQEGRQAGTQAYVFLCVCVFRATFERVRCEGVLYHYGNMEFPAILGPKSPVSLGIPLKHNAVCMSGSSLAQIAADFFRHFPMFFKGALAAISA